MNINKFCTDCSMGDCNFVVCKRTSQAYEVSLSPTFYRMRNIYYLDPKLKGLSSKVMLNAKSIGLFSHV